MREELEKNEKKDVQSSMESNFYIEELEERLEMSAASPSIENSKFCVVWVTPIS